MHLSNAGTGRIFCRDSPIPRLRLRPVAGERRRDCREVRLCLGSELQERIAVQGTQSISHHLDVLPDNSRLPRISDVPGATQIVPVSIPPRSYLVADAPPGVGCLPKRPEDTSLVLHREVQ